LNRISRETGEALTISLDQEQKPVALSFEERMARYPNIERLKERLFC